MSQPEAVLDTRPGHPGPGISSAAERVRLALADLPAAEQDEVRARLAEVVANYEQTRQVDPLIHFVESLLVTARLNRNPAFRKGVDDAAADVRDRDGAEPSGSGNVADLMAAMRERRRTS